MTTRDRRILASVVFVTLFAQVLLYPGIADLVTALGATTELDASMWFLLAEFGAFIAFAGVWGVASDAAGRRVPFIALGALGGAIGYLSLAALPVVEPRSFAVVLGIRVLQGGAVIGAFSLAITMLMDLGGGHGRNMGAAGIAIGGGTALGAPIGGQLYGLGPLVPLYAAAALFLLVVPAITLVTDRAPSGTGTGGMAALADLRRQPSLGVPFAFGFVDRLTAGFFALGGVFYFRDQFGLAPGAIGLLLMLFFAPFALLQYPFGIVSDRVGRAMPIVGGSIGYGIAVVLVGVTPSLAVTAGMLLLVGVCGALVAPATMALVTDLAADTRRGTAMAGFNIFGSLGFLAGIAIAGMVIAAAGFRAAFGLVGSLEIGIALASIPVFRRLGFRFRPGRGE